MRALVFTGIKQPLEYKEIEPQTNRPEAVEVNVLAAALNRRDFWITLGMYPGIVFPTILGSDGCGMYKGKEVIFSPNVDWGSGFFPDPAYKILGLEYHGTFAEKIWIPKSHIFQKPKHLTSQQAAALPLAGLTAYRALFSRCQAKAGENVLISGVGGGVALFAMQFAIAAGCNVWVTSGSEEKIEKAKAMGALGGASYKDADALKKLGKTAGGFDVIIDSAGGSGFNNLLKLCRMGARVGVYGGTAGNYDGVSVPNVFFKQITILGSTMGSDRDFEKMVRFVRKHKIVPVVDTVLPLEKGNEALAVLAKGGQFGKVVLEV